MNEQFDRALRNHIRDTFDHYDDLMAHDGWIKFQKRKNRKKRGLVLWYAMPSGIAAALALLWIFNITTNDIVKTESNPVAQNEASQFPKTILENQKGKIKKSDVFVKQGNSKLITSIKKDIQKHLNQNEPVKNSVNSLSVEKRPQLSLVSTKEINFDRFKTDYTKQHISFNEQILENKNVKKNNDNREYLAFKTDLLKNSNTYAQTVSADDKTAEKKKNSNFNFAVDANTFYSFTSAGVSNDLNLGIGVLSELKLSKRLSVNSGISLNKQSAVYQNSQQNSSSQSFDSPSASPNSFVSQISKQSISVSEGVKTNAKLVGFDIPINLKYNIPLGKAKTFISTGVSSYSLLNQSYVNDISVTNYSLTSTPTTTVLRNVEEETESAFSNFQFARTVNFSIGILYPLSTANSISVEPFVKYPIAGFGNRDLEIGSGGISFKLNFGK